MNIASTEITIDIQTSVFIITSLIGSVYVIIKIFRSIDQKRISSIKKTISDIDKLCSNIPIIKEKITEIYSIIEKIPSINEKILLNEKSIDYIEKNLNNACTIIEKIREDLYDARETISGFGKDYVSRKELLEEKEGKK